MTAEAITRPHVTHSYFVPSPLSEIKYGKMKFLISDRPNDFSLESYAKVGSIILEISDKVVALGTGKT